MPLPFARHNISDKDLVNKCKKAPKRSAVRGGNSIATQIEIANKMAKEKLQHHSEEYMIIRDVDSLENYLEKGKQKGIMAVDTETTGLNPLVDKLVGVCLYTPGEKAVYVPVGHKSYITGLRTSDQVGKEQLSVMLQNYKDEILWVMHNSKFDIRVLRHSLGVNLKCFWDTMLASYCINENENHQLKELHIKYCNSTDEEALSFGKLFKGVSFDNIPITIAYLYAAGDAIKTYELFNEQQKLLNRRTMPGPFNVFREIETPLVEVVCDMEDRGVTLDIDFCEQLSSKYAEMRKSAYTKAYEVLDTYSELIDFYKENNKNHKLSDPISFTSPVQLAVLFYDIFKLTSPDNRTPRGTGIDILNYFKDNSNYGQLCACILEIRRIDKLINTYIDKMPGVALEDGRIHANFNQYGAKTGRFSSSDPNLQNIPSHNKEIRQMFKAQEGYVLIGADYSQQEPMVTAFLSQDKKMQKAFIEGKDIYATIASLAFHKDYEECLEFDSEGNVQYDGKERRGRAKIIVLSILYGKQIPGIAEDLGVSTKEAQAIYNSVLNAFPELASFINESQDNCKKFGFVTTAWGRRRNLPDMQLNEYDFKYDSDTIAFDPLSFDEKIHNEVPAKVKNKYLGQLRSAWGFDEKKKIISNARSEGILIKNNGAFISQAQRQCVNSRVQGSAADMIKLAMILVNNDSVLKTLDFHLILQVHDEIIGECPRENMSECAERLEYLMKLAPSKKIDLPFKCDVSISQSWYGEEISG